MPVGYTDVNLGSAANDGNGSPIRTAFSYINTNFSGLYTPIIRSTNPNSVLTPRWTGDSVLQSTDNIWYQSVSLNPTGWVPLNYPYTFSGLYSYQTSSANPTGVVQPRWIGEECLRSPGHIWYKAVSMNITGWVALN